MVTQKAMVSIVSLVSRGIYAESIKNSINAIKTYDTSHTYNDSYQPVTSNKPRLQLNIYKIGAVTIGIITIAGIAACALTPAGVLLLGAMKSIGSLLLSSVGIAATAKKAALVGSVATGAVVSAGLAATSLFIYKACRKEQKEAEDSGKTHYSSSDSICLIFL